MAEGGYFGYDDPKLDDDLDHDDDDDDEQETNKTRPFQLGASSTPYHGGEQHEMRTMWHEQSRLSDTSYEETPLIGDLLEPEERKRNLDKAVDYITKRFLRVDLNKLGPIGYRKKGTQADIVSLGSKGGETKILKKMAADL